MVFPDGYACNIGLNRRKRSVRETRQAQVIMLELGWEADKGPVDPGQVVTVRV